MIQKQSPARKEYMDLLRIICIIWVIFNHTGTNGFQYFTIVRDSALFGFYLFCAVICKTAVPIFLMISGALLLKKDEPVSVVLKKRFLKFLIILLVASFTMDLYYKNWDFGLFSFESFLKTVYSDNIANSHWYLYIYLGYVLTLPLLRRMSAGMAAKDYFYLTCLMAIPPVLRCFELFCLNYEVHYNEDFSVFSTLILVYYPLMGDFLANKISDEELTGKKVLLLGGSGLIFIVINCWLTCVWCQRFDQWQDQNEVFMGRFLFIPAAAIFVAVRYLFMKVHFSSSVRKCITYLSSCTFGIFLFEKVFRQSTIVVFAKLSAHIPQFSACTAWVFCAFFMGVVFISIGKKIPVIKHFL